MILVTGGTGYIGSHTCVALAQAGHQLLILDNLSNSRADVVDRLATICGRRPVFVEGDCRDAGLLDEVFDRHSIQGQKNPARPVQNRRVANSIPR
jgi:UDP-glucose 4-epimerase